MERSVPSLVVMMGSFIAKGGILLTYPGTAPAVVGRRQMALGGCMQVVHSEFLIAAVVVAEGMACSHPSL